MQPRSLPDGQQSLKTVALVAAHFPPSNLAGVHRARLWAQHLSEFGWRPIIVTTHWDYYEEPLDWDLHALVDPALEVVRTRALPTHPMRIVGDIGIRALLGHYRALSRLASQGRIDFVHVTVPSHYSALLGRLIHERHGIPYGIDYIDPWIYSVPDSEPDFGKSRLSQRLGLLLEPWAVRKASLITGVAPLYFEDVLRRNPHLREGLVTKAMPYGASARDFEFARESKRPPTLFDPADGCFHIVYAGALMPMSVSVLERLLQALACVREEAPELYARLRLHFIGTGKSPTDPNGYNVMLLAEKLGVDGVITEHPHRMAYVDVLIHLVHASGILILGSTERHYTPSKIFQAIQAKRPVLALMHEASTAQAVLRESGAGISISLNEVALPSPAVIAERLRAFMTRPWQPDSFNSRIVDDAYSARRSAELLTEGLREATAASRHRHVRPHP